MRKKIDLTGKRFGNLIVLYDVGERRRGYVVWRCKCECGNHTSVLSYRLKSGNTKSCGCLKRNSARKNAVRHNMSNSSEYNSYQAAKKRCENPNHHAYQNYGGRSIKFLFENFEEFYGELGPKPTIEHTIDRYPNRNGNYECGNVRWATREQQNRNKRDTILDSYTIKEIQKLLDENWKQKDIAEIFGVSRSEISNIKTKRRWKNIK